MPGKLFLVAVIAANVAYMEAICRIPSVWKLPANQLVSLLDEIAADRQQRKSMVCPLLSASYDEWLRAGVVVNVVTTMDKSGGYFLQLQETIARAGGETSWRLHVADNSVPASNAPEANGTRRWGGFIHKMRATRQVVESLPACAVVLFVDAWDTMINNASAIATLFPAKAGKVVVAEEDWGSLQLPGTDIVDQYLLGLAHRLIFASRPQCRGVNSGVLLGRAADVARLLAATAALEQRLNVGDDQVPLNVMKCGHHPELQQLWREMVDTDTDQRLQTNVRCPVVMGSASLALAHPRLCTPEETSWVNDATLVLHGNSRVSMERVGAKLGVGHLLSPAQRETHRAWTSHVMVNRYFVTYPGNRFAFSAHLGVACFLVALWGAIWNYGKALVVAIAVYWGCAWLASERLGRL